MKTGNTRCSSGPAWKRRPASMEPGHEDREYLPHQKSAASHPKPPQWSPVMKTGNTSGKFVGMANIAQPQWSPVMKTGNTGRPGRRRPRSRRGLNGARS